MEGHALCIMVISGLATGIVGVSGALWQVLKWYRIEAKERLKDAQRALRILEGRVDDPGSA